MATYFRSENERDRHGRAELRADESEQILVVGSGIQKQAVGSIPISINRANSSRRVVPVPDRWHCTARSREH